MSKCYNDASLSSCASRCCTSSSFGTCAYTYATCNYYLSGYNTSYFNSKCYYDVSNSSCLSRCCTYYGSCASTLYECSFFITGYNSNYWTNMNLVGQNNKIDNFIILAVLLSIGLIALICWFKVKRDQKLQLTEKNNKYQINRSQLNISQVQLQNSQAQLLNLRRQMPASQINNNNALSNYQNSSGELITPYNGHVTHRNDQNDNNKERINKIKQYQNPMNASQVKIFETNDQQKDHSAKRQTTIIQPQETLKNSQINRLKSNLKKIIEQSQINIQISNQ